MRTSLIAAAVVAALAGCVDVEETLTLNADGSGTLVTTYTIPTALLEAEEAYKNLADDALGPQLAADIEKQLEEKKTEGLAIDDVAVEAVDEEFLRITIGASFQDVAVLEKIQAGGGLSVEPGPGEKKKDAPGPMARKVKLEKKDGGWTLQQTILLSEKEKKEPDPMSEQIDPLMRAAFAGHKMRFTVVLPGEIETAEGAQVEGDTATWEFRIADTINETKLGPLEATAKAGE